MGQTQSNMLRRAWVCMCGEAGPQDLDDGDGDHGWAVLAGRRGDGHRRDGGYNLEAEGGWCWRRRRFERRHGARDGAADACA